MFNNDSFENTIASAVTGINDHTEGDKRLEMSSQNHAILQMRLGVQLSLYDTYTVASELSIDVSTPERQKILGRCQVKAERELKPDLAIYPAEEFDFIDPEEGSDPVRVTKIPRACIEIISPSQSTHEIINKFRAYFELGVQSCWYVDSNLKLVKVYSSMKSKDTKTFEKEDEVTDSVLGVSVALSKMFGKYYTKS
jgi:Uma2 family endonuclease